jgi:hypothetical protein
VETKSSSSSSSCSSSSFAGEDEDEDDDEDEKQKCLHFHKTRNEGKSGIQTKTVRLAGLILLFAEKRSGTPEPTSAFQPVS